jgi:hypothetical protein
MTSAMQSKRKTKHNRASCFNLFKKRNVGSMALQFHKVKGSKFFTGFSVSRQGSKALDLSDFPARFQQVQQSASKVPAMFQ